MIIEVIFEICVKGMGYLICRPFSRLIDPDGAFVGIFAWALIVVLFVVGYDYLSVQAEIDRCLDAGGSYDYQNESCNK